MLYFVDATELVIGGFYGAKAGTGEVDASTFGRSLLIYTLLSRFFAMTGGVYCF